MKASDLEGFGTEDWIFRLLRNPGHNDFFGRVTNENIGDMDEFISKTRNYGYAKMSDKEFAAALKEEENDADREKLKKKREQQTADLKLLAKWLAARPGREDPEVRQEQWYKNGKELFDDKCLRCHKIDGEGESERGPDLTGYGDATWLREMILSPHSARRYGINNSMPGFRPLEGVKGEFNRRAWNDLTELLSRKKNEGNDPMIAKEVKAASQLTHLSDIDRELIIRWLLKDNRVVFGGEEISGPPKK